MVSDTPYPFGAPSAPGPPLRRPGEAAEAYLARLRAEQVRLARLVADVEAGAVPAAAPVAPVSPLHERGRHVDRRARPADRRRGPKSRRSARHDRRARATPHPPGSERRAAHHDRRSGRLDRRFGNDRRSHRTERPLPAEPAVDPTILFWALNVLCWVAVVTVAMIWGLG